MSDTIRSSDQSEQTPSSGTTRDPEKVIHELMMGYPSSRDLTIGSSDQPGPRVWELPAQPGRDVTAVVDYEGDTWHRVLGESEGADRWRSGLTDAVYAWMDVLEYAPLTEVRS